MKHGLKLMSDVGHLAERIDDPGVHVAGATNDRHRRTARGRSSSIIERKASTAPDVTGNAGPVGWCSAGSSSGSPGRVRPPSERGDMPAFQPTGDQFRAFRDDPYEGPIAQVNLLKFRVKAEYTPNDPEYGYDEPGSAAYMRYAEQFGVIAAEVGGAPLLIGGVERYFIGNGDWDAVMVMQFPSRAAFIATLNHERYADMSRHRNAGLLCQELLTTRPSA